MKRPETMIREFELANDIKGRELRLYNYVRPLKGGEATIEVWGAMNHRRRKNAPLVVKHFFTFRTDRDAYRVRDALNYTSYSQMAHDHICYHFSEAGGGDYGHHLHEMKGVWGWLSLKHAEEAHLPSYATMLNGWDGTKYRYCAYDPMCGMSAISYARMYARHQKAEILSKMKQFQLLTDEFLTRLEDKDFMRYVGRNHGNICLHHMTASNIVTAYNRGKTCEEYMKKIIFARKERERIAREKYVAEQLRQTEEMRKTYRKWNKKMLKLYERIKAICGEYGAYEVVVPKTSDEMVDEGIAMHNCIGRCYTSNHATGHDIIIFFRKDGKPCIDMRIDPKEMEIKEVRSVCNKDEMKNAEVMEQANKVLANLKRVWKEAA